MDPVNWTHIETDVREWMVRTLGALTMGCPIVPYQFPLNQVTCLSVKEHKVNMNGIWWYDLVSKADSLRDQGLRSKTEVLGVLIHDLDENIKTSLNIVRTLAAAFYAHFGTPYGKEASSDLVSSVIMYLPMTDKDQKFIPFLKYQLSYLFAKAMKQTELPERYDSVHNDGTVLLGNLGRMFRLRTMGGKTKNLEWLNTILHGIKKGLPQMGPELLAQNLKKHQARLMNESETPEPLLEAVERTAREVFPNKVFFEDYCDNSKYVSLSRNACFENTRSNFGPLGVAYRKWLGSDCSDTQACYWMWKLDLELDRMFYFPRLNLTREVYIPFPFVREQLPLDQRLSLNCLDDSVARDHMIGGLDRNDENLKYKGKASVKAIFEPLKVRLITAGDYLSNGIWSKLQKTLWSKMQRFPQLSLTGKSAEISDLDWIQERTLDIAAFDWWVSGDYSAATDNMKMDTTLAALGAISGDPMTQSILLKGLCGNMVTYEALAQDGVDVPSDFVMKRGQLMGCIFSFVFLCIVNLAVYRYSLEEYLGERFSIRELPVRVNGDDILFKANSDFFPMWERNIKGVGFEKSVGKNYVSEDFAIINSTLYDTRDVTEIREIPYLNMGWVTGVQKGGGTMRMNKERTKTLTNDLRRIRPQIDQTEEDWLSDLRGVGETKRRLTIFRRYQQQVLWFNWSEIERLHLPTDSAHGGLGLTERLTTDPYSNGFRRFLLRSGRKSVLNTDLPLEEICPEALGPWKIKMILGTGEDLEELHNDYRSSPQRKHEPTYRNSVLPLEGIVKRIKDMFAENFRCEIVDGSSTCRSLCSVLGEGFYRETKAYRYDIAV